MISVNKDFCLLASQVRIPSRVLQRISINTRAIHQTQRIRLNVPPGRRVVVPHPVLVEAALKLEPLAGEAQVNAAGGGMHTAEWQIRRLPDLHAQIVGGKDGTAASRASAMRCQATDLVGADAENLTSFNPNGSISGKSYRFLRTRPGCAVTIFLLALKLMRLGCASACQDQNSRPLISIKSNLVYLRNYHS